MKNIKNILILQLLVFGLVFVSCSKDYDDPAPQKIHTDSDFGTITNISTLKNLYYTQYGSNIIGKSLVITDDIVIKGKVISSDLNGNIYRSLYIQDASGAIEIKIGKGQMYNDYPVGRTIYVKAKGLTLGNYRFMLSLGGASEDASYANGYIDVKSIIDNQILKGEFTQLTSADTLVITSPSQINDPEDLGRLCRFENVVSKFGTITDDGFSNNDIYPSYLESISTNGITTYQSYTFEEKGLPNTWAYNYNSDSFYGSCLFVLGGTKGLVIRSSGYSKFALREIPYDGTACDITAILTKYSSSSGGFQKYQLVLNKAEDVVVR